MIEYLVHNVDRWNKEHCVLHAFSTALTYYIGDYKPKFHSVYGQDRSCLNRHQVNNVDTCDKEPSLLDHTVIVHILVTPFNAIPN